MNKVFLGGTCNGSTWREQLISKLEIDYFNPVVEDWNEEARKKEESEKLICDYHLYVITPEMTGFFTIAEVMESVMLIRSHCIFGCLESYGGSQFNSRAMRSINAIRDRFISYEGKFFDNLTGIASYLNSKKDGIVNPWKGECND